MPDNQAIIFTPTDFVAVLNQTLDYAYPQVIIQGELAELRISKGRWVYFKLKDQQASVSFFATTAQLQHGFEAGMMVQVQGFPRLHPLYGFSVQVQAMQPAGEGSIKKAADILMESLRKEGLFSPERKRPLPFPPTKIGLIASNESAAYQDFLKILGARWTGLEIVLHNVAVQGERAIKEVTEAVDFMNKHYAEDLDVLVITRGGGSPDDLAAFSSEPVTRAVANSTIPTLVAIGHEIDVSLAELAADQRASTPSNAAELLVPDRQEVQRFLTQTRKHLSAQVKSTLQGYRAELQHARQSLAADCLRLIDWQRTELRATGQLLTLLHPEETLKRGFALVRNDQGSIITSVDQIHSQDGITVGLRDGSVQALVQSVHREQKPTKKRGKKS